MEPGRDPAPRITTEQKRLVSAISCTVDQYTGANPHILVTDTLAALEYIRFHLTEQLIKMTRPVRNDWPPETD